MAEGVTLMFMGMGTVFFFLTLLVVVTSLMSSLIQKYEPKPLIMPKTPESPGPLDDQILLAVISAAIHKHRAR
ncbi:MAG: OadG family protein [Candidatus Accumulibacter meliphilus]|jgi:oxaloacetate decarboxylase gamma subunit|uniref:OadG family protein n=1 Tax=Candidatus Accumulibacter meliphilus TaxID=2211374 RepID=UPI002FC2DA15